MNYNTPENERDKEKIYNDIKFASTKFYYDNKTVIKYLRKVLNCINSGYTDNGLRAGFLMKRYIERFGSDEDKALGPKLVLLCLLKDIGKYYHDGFVPKDNPALAAAASYCFLKYCSPLGDASKPLLYYKARYIPTADNQDYKYGLLITLISEVIMYDYQEYTLRQIIDLLKEDNRGIFDPEQVKLVIKLLEKEPDILEKLNSKGSIFVYETTSYMFKEELSDSDLLGYINLTNFAFEFHNHETLAHTVTVAIIARELAKLSRLTENMCEEIYLAGLVHDIGKILVPTEILCYPGKLEGDMLKEMRMHVTYTREILTSSFGFKIVEIASNHHEKLDGSGYPKGLRAIDLSIGDKIIAVADMASALYCRRSYKASFDDEKIISILQNDSTAGKIDKRIVNHLVEHYDEIMALAKEREQVVLNIYDEMVNMYNKLKDSQVLYRFFPESETKQ